MAKVWLFLTITSKHYYRSLTSRVTITRSLKRSTSSLAHLSLQILYNHIPTVISHNSWNTFLHSYICETGDICMWNICLLCKIVNAWGETRSFSFGITIQHWCGHQFILPDHLPCEDHLWFWHKCCYTLFPHISLVTQHLAEFILLILTVQLRFHCPLAIKPLNFREKKYI